MTEHSAFFRARACAKVCSIFVRVGYFCHGHRTFRKITGSSPKPLASHYHLTVMFSVRFPRSKRSESCLNTLCSHGVKAMVVFQSSQIKVSFCDFARLTSVNFPSLPRHSGIICSLLLRSSSMTNPPLHNVKSDDTGDVPTAR